MLVLYRSANDCRTANDTRTANDPHNGPQMIPEKSKEWHGGWNGLDRELNSAYFYHAVINLPHLNYRGYYDQKLTWAQF